MSRYSGNNPYLDPNSGVLLNWLGIYDQAILDEVEADLVAVLSYELPRDPIKGNFDLAHLRAIHRYQFRDLYKWAGELRTLTLARE